MKGTIRERVKKDGSTVYACQVEAGRDPPTNKRRYRTATAPTRREANSLLHELMREINGEAGRVDEGTTMTLGALMERWLELGGPAAALTRQVYAGYIKNQIKPHLWDVRLDPLKVADMDRWYLVLRESGLKPASRPVEVRALQRHDINFVVGGPARPPPHCAFGSRHVTPRSLRRPARRERSSSMLQRFSGCATTVPSVKSVQSEPEFGWRRNVSSSPRRSTDGRFGVPMSLLVGFDTFAKGRVWARRRGTHFGTGRRQP